MANDVNYQAMANQQANPFIDKSSHPNHEALIIDETTDTENEDAHRDNSIMIHVVPDTSKGLHLPTVLFQIFWIKCDLFY